MKFFQSIQRTFSHIGIDPKKSKRMYPLNATNSKNCLIYLLACICSIVFLFHEANSIEERVDGGFLAGLLILNMICYTHLNFKMKLVYNFFDSANKIVEQSELLQLYWNHINQILNKLNF